MQLVLKEKSYIWWLLDYIWNNFVICNTKTGLNNKSM